MKGNKSNFKTEKLLVHWLEISIEGFYDLDLILVHDVKVYKNGRWIKI